MLLLCAVGTVRALMMQSLSAVESRSSRSGRFDIVKKEENLQRIAMESMNPCCSVGRIRWRGPDWPSARRASLGRSRDVLRKPFRRTYLLNEKNEIFISIERI